MKVTKGVRRARPVGMTCSEFRGKNCVTFYVRQGKVIVKEKNVKSVPEVKKKIVRVVAREVLMSLRVVK
jgi:hypothetical protein